jgi:aminomethyltransferase
LIAEGTPRRRVGIILDSKAPAREGASIVTPQGETIGHVTSGGYAPSLGRAIGMGYVATAHAGVGTKLNILVRGKALPAAVAAMPFVPNRYHRGN